MSKFRIAVLVGAVVLATASIPMRPNNAVQAKERPARFALLAIQAADAPPSAQPDDQLPPGPGRDVTARVCTQCHEVKTFADKRYSEDKWDSVLDDMTAKGMNASDEDLETIRKYLDTSMTPASQGKGASDRSSAPGKN
jgi:mono/diheme cytochrome c family protein